MTNIQSVSSNQEKWQVMFPHIAGYDKVRAEGAQIIDMIQRKDAYKKVGAYCPRGWFFYGAPGMGKTRLVKDIAEYVGYPIIEISSSDAIRRKVGIEEDIVRGFEEAKQIGKCIVFIDEMDKFAGYRKYAYEMPDNLKNQKILLHELDGIKDHDDVIVIATGNKRNYLDEALLRAGRFDRQVWFSLPKEDDRRAIIKHFLKGSSLDDNVLLDDLVKMTADMSCAEIECMVNEAKISLVHKGAKALQLSDFTAALNRIIFCDIPKENIKSNEQSKLVAYHEIGHALMCYFVQPENLHCVSIIPQGSSAGATNVTGDDNIIKDERYYEGVLKIALSGMTAVRVMTGTMTCGNKSDIDKIFETVTNMLDEGFYGMEYISFVVNDDAYNSERYSKTFTEKRAAKIVEITNKAQMDVEQLLNNHKDVIELLATKLVEKRELSNREIVDIIENTNKRKVK